MRFAPRFAHEVFVTTLPPDFPATVGCDEVYTGRADAQDRRRRGWHPTQEAGTERGSTPPQAFGVGRGALGLR
jgi:hypothetical protein